MIKSGTGRIAGCIFAVIALTACILIPVDTSPRPCTSSLEVLLLEDSAFPSGWSRGQPSKNNQFSSLATDQCGASYYVLNGLATEEVYKYKSIEDATHDYSDLAAYLFPKNASPLPTPQVSTSETDEFRLTCSIPTTIPMCEILARHGSYIFHFNTHMSPNFMSEQNLVRIVQAIDSKMKDMSN